MFDLGWTEMLVIGIVALIVIGPKDLPVMFRTLQALLNAWLQHNKSTVQHRYSMIEAGK